MTLKCQGTLGQTKVTFYAVGSAITINSLTLIDRGQRAFEWLDYSQALEATADLVLDVEDNLFAGGDGQEATPYLVANPRQLDNIRRNSSDKFFKQIKDIDFQASCQTSSEQNQARFYNNGTGWQPLGVSYKYSSTIVDQDQEISNTVYDGGNYCIKNLHINRALGDMYISVSSYQEYIGLFGRVIDGTTIKNLTMDDSCSIYVYTPESKTYGSNTFCSFVGAICGMTNEDYLNGGTAPETGTEKAACLIDNCQNQASVVVKADSATNIDTAKLQVIAGGISGKIVKTTCQNCTNIGAIETYTGSGATSNIAGGIVGVGDFNSTIAKCRNSKTALIHNETAAAHSLSGGICGHLNVNSSISQSQNDGQIESVTNKLSDSRLFDGLGGISGLNSYAAKVQQSVNTGALSMELKAPDPQASSVPSAYVGGIAAINYNHTDNVETTDVGYNIYSSSNLPLGSAITDCYNTGKIDFNIVNDGNYLYAGGICGFNFTNYGVSEETIKSKVASCYSCGAINKAETSMMLYHAGYIIGKDYNTIVGNQCYFRPTISLDVTGIADVSDTANIHKCTASQMANSVKVLATDGVSVDKYVYEILNQAATATWVKNSQDDGALGEGILKGFSILDWQIN